MESKLNESASEIVKDVVAFRLVTARRQFGVKHSEKTEFIPLFNIPSAPFGFFKLLIIASV